MPVGRLTYWAVIWGDNIRLSQKCVSSRTACFQTYGLQTSDMEPVDLGPVKRLAFKKFDKIMKKRKLSAK